MATRHTGTMVGKLVPPHDKNVIAEVDAISSVDEVLWSGGEENISMLGKGMDDAFIDMVKGLSIYPEVIEKQHDLKIVLYTHTWYRYNADARST